MPRVTGFKSPVPVRAEQMSSLYIINGRLSAASPIHTTERRIWHFLPDVDLHHSSAMHVGCQCVQPELLGKRAFWLARISIRAMSCMHPAEDIFLANRNVMELEVFDAHRRHPPIAFSVRGTSRCDLSRELRHVERMDVPSTCY